MKRIAHLLALSLVAAPALLCCAAAPAYAAAAPVNASDLFTNTVVAKGKGLTITRSQLDEEVIRVKSLFAAQGGTPPPDVDARVLDTLITKQLILSQATEADRASGKAQFQTAVTNLMAQSKLSEDEFYQKLQPQLRLMNVTKEQWIRQNIDQATLRAVIERELKPAITEADARKYYDDNSATFEHPEMVRVAHVLIGTRDPLNGAELSDEQKAAKKKVADDIVKRARAGEDFAKLVKQYSDDPGSKEKGGEYTFARASADPDHAMMPEFEKAAFALNTNQVSDVVTTPYGYHVLKLYEKIPARKEAFAGTETKTTLTKNDGQVATISEILSGQSIEKQVPVYVKKLRADADLQILDERLKLLDSVTDSPDARAATNAPAKPSGK